MESAYNVVLPTGIIADKVTPNGNIYCRQPLSEAINEYNNVLVTECYHYGSMLNRKHIQMIGELTHRTVRIFINDVGMVCACVAVRDEKVIELIKANKTILARLTMAIPAFIHDMQTKPRIISVIDKIIRVQLEVKDELDGNQRTNT